MFEKTYAEVVQNHLRTLRIKLFPPNTVQVPQHVAQAGMDTLRSNFSRDQATHLALMTAIEQAITELNGKVQRIKVLAEISGDLTRMERAVLEHQVNERNSELEKINREMKILKVRIKDDLSKL